MAGRPRKPTALKELHGTVQPCRSNPLEPKPELGFPVPPDHLSDEARATWQQAYQLSRSWVAMSDVFAMEELATQYATLIHIRTVLRDKGMTYETTGKDGSVMVRPRPEVAMEAEAKRHFLALLGRFGLTPSDRAKVSTNDTPKDDEDLSAWLA